VGACRRGVCGIGACTAGFADCDGNATNGCETPIDTISNCGSCGRVCAFTNGIPACTAGACVLSGCSARNYRDCDANASTGCERDINTDPTSCGGCGIICRSHIGSATPCVGGACTPTCNAGYGNCNGVANDGCEASLGTNLNCGACGRACANGQVCRSGACVASTTVTYSRSGVATSFVDVCTVAGSTHLLPSTDDAGAVVPLPFNFTYWGTPVTAGSRVNVSSNGFISLDGTVNGNLQGIIPDPAAPNGVIAAWWTDLVTSATGVCAATIGATPYRRFVVQWSSATYYGNRTADLNFEIVLHESTNLVEILYQRLVPLPAGYVPTVGLESISGVQGTTVCSTTGSNCTIASGAAYRFIPQ